MSTLSEELATDPLGRGYAAMTDGEREASLNAKDRTRIVSRFITARTILAECDDGAAILDKLEAAAVAISAVKWAMKFLCTDGGLDIGHPRTQGMVDQLVTGGVLTSAEGAALKAMAVQTCSRAEELGIGAIGADIRNARA